MGIQISGHLASSTLNPNQHGLFGLSIAQGGGGGKCPPRFLGGYGLIFHPNESNMVSNESWDLYQPKESLNTLL